MLKTHCTFDIGNHIYTKLFSETNFTEEIISEIVIASYFGHVTFLINKKNVDKVNLRARE